MQQLTLNLHGVTVQFKSDDPRLLRFVERNLGCFAGAPSPDTPTVEGVYRLAHKYRTLEAVAADAEAALQVGTGLFVGQAAVVWAVADWYTYFLQHGQSKICTTLFASGGTKRKVKDIGRAALRPGLHQRVKGSRITQAMRLLVHFPVFWLLEQTRGIAVIHGAAVARNGRAIVLTGLDGVGKSTLALYLCQHRGFSLLADNFVLTDGEQILSFPEMTRLSKDSIKAVGLDGQGFEQLGQRTYLSTDAFTTVLTAECAAIITNRIGSGLHLETVESTSTEAELGTMWRYLPEFLDYGRFRALCTYLGGAPWPNDNVQAVNRLTINSPCFLLVKDSLQRLSEAADMVEKCI